MNKNNLTLPVAIIAAALLIGGAIIYTNTQSRVAPLPTPTDTVMPDTIAVRPVSSADHILGSADAKVTMIEYSDTECPFCKQFQASMQKIMDTYGADNSVAWVYRHFPIPQLHPRAPHEAEATECVSQLGGQDKFWQYLNLIYSTTPSNNGLDPAQLPILAGQVGIDTKAFQSCLDSGKYTEAITNSYNEARALGAQGTPFTIIVAKNPVSPATVKQLQDLFTVAGTQMQISSDKLGYVTKDGKVVLNGALPYEVVQQIIAILLS